jgi:hypothetical protein
MNRTIALCTKIAFAVVVLALALAGSPIAHAQGSPYSLGYYPLAHQTSNTVPDGTLRLVNDGNVSDAAPAGDLCGAIYSFRQHGEHARVLQLQHNPERLSLALRQYQPDQPRRAQQTTHAGRDQGPFADDQLGELRPDERQPATRNPWVDRSPSKRAGSSFQITETELKEAPLDAGELADLQEDCQVILIQGNGAGGFCTCTDAGR